MANIRVKDLDTKASFASDDEILMDSPSGTGTMLRDAFIAAVASQIVAAPSTYKIATLDGANKLTSSQDPSQSVSYLGGHDMVANSPALADGSGTAGDTYYVTNPGTRNYGSGNITAQEGDALVYSGSVWQLVEGIANILDGISTASTARTTLSVNSKDEDAQANALKTTAPALYFNGTSSVVTVADDPKQSFGNGTTDRDFGMFVKFNAKTLKNAYIVCKGTTASLREYGLQLRSDGKLRFYLRDNSVPVEIYAETVSAVISVDQWYSVVATVDIASASTARADDISIYVNGEAEAVTASNQATYVAMEDAGSTPLLLGGGASTYFSGEISHAQIHNRTLTATEAARLSRVGQLGFADEWGGALGGVYTQDATPSGEWTGVNATDADESGPIGGRSDVLKVTVDNTNNQHYAYVGGLTAGKRYRLSFDYYIPSGQSNVDGLIVRNGTSGTTVAVYTAASPTLGAWNTASAEFVASATGNPDRIRIDALDGGASTFTDAGGDDVFYIDGLTITEIGKLADFRSERFDSSTGKWYDLSDNAFVGTNNGATLVGREVPVYETGTWTPSITFGGGSTGVTYGTQEGYYTRIGNQVTIHGSITLTSKGTDTGQFKVAGLPYTAANTSGSLFSACIGYSFNWDASITAQPALVVADNDTTLFGTVALAGTLLTDTAFSNTTVLRFSATYQIQ